MTDFDPNMVHFIGVPAFVLSVEANGRIVYEAVNDDWCEWAGRRAQDVIGQTSIEAFGGRFGAMARDRYDEVLASRQRLSFDLTIPGPEALRHVRGTLIPVVSSAGEVHKIVGVSVDRTAEIRAAEMQLSISSARADLENYISLAAHDLRSPLRNISNLADMLRDGFEDLGDGKLELINLLEVVAVKGTDLVSDILAHAQAVDARQSEERFNLAKLTEDVFVVLDPRQRHHLSVEDVWLKADVVSVQIVLRNLCDNAIKHCAKDQVRLEVSVTQRPDQMLEFMVRDDGDGFQDPAIAFLEGGRLRTDSGFGLLGVRRLVTTRGGQIDVENLPGKAGCVILFTLPGVICDGVLSVA